MHKIVLDTNVLISGLIGKGKPKRILELVFSGDIALCLSSEVYREYVEVTNRPKFSRYYDFKEAADRVLRSLRVLAQMVQPHQRLYVCPDKDDNKFLELAIEAKANYLITGNVKHFPNRPFRGIKVLLPSKYLELRSNIT